jgi:hypothetical protein
MCNTVIFKGNKHIKEKKKYGREGLVVHGRGESSAA